MIYTLTTSFPDALTDLMAIEAVVRVFRDNGLPVTVTSGDGYAEPWGHERVIIATHAAIDRGSVPLASLSGQMRHVAARVKRELEQENVLLTVAYGSAELV